MDYLIEYKVFARAMKFSRPDMLFLIWAVPMALLVFLYGNRKRRKILSRYSSAKGLAMLIPNADRKQRRLKNFLILLILVLMSVSLAGPQYGYRWEEIERKGIDIIVAMDCSKSMLAADIKPSRLERSKREIYDLLNILKGDRIGLVAYSGTSFLQCPLTMDYSAFHIFLNTLTPDMMPVGGTNISEALLTALSSFDEKTKSDKAVILITDGDNTGGDPVEAAQSLAKADVRLFAIGVGTDSGVPVPETSGGLKKDKSGNIVLSKLDEELLKKIAVLTGGAYVRSASGGMSLDEIYNKEIRGKLEAATLTGGRRQIWEDRYQWILAVAILAFIIEIFLSSEKSRVTIVILCILHVVLCTLHCPSAFAGSAQQAQEAYQKGEYDKSLKLFIDAQLENPDKPEISYNIGNAYYKSGRYHEAAANFKQAAQSKNPQLRQKALYNLGNANYKNNNLDEAVKNYEEAISLDPKDTQAKDNLEFVKKVIEQKKQQQKNEQNQKDQQDKEQQDKDKSDKQDQEENKDSDTDKKNSGDTSEEGDNKPEEEKGDSGKPDQSEEKSEEQQTSDKPSDKKEETHIPKDGEKQDEAPTPESESDPKSESVQQTNPSDKPPENGEAHRQAERALNRLNDQPGKAMIPVYKKQMMEKDW